MYSKCKCCVELLKIQPLDKKRDIKFQELVNAIGIPPDTQPAEYYDTCDVIVRLPNSVCPGLDSKICSIDIVADMSLYNIKILSRDKYGKFISYWNSSLGNNPTTALKWHSEVISHMKCGTTLYTKYINDLCAEYYNNKYQKPKEILVNTKTKVKSKTKGYVPKYKRGPYKKRKIQHPTKSLEIKY